MKHQKSILQNPGVNKIFLSDIEFNVTLRSIKSLKDETEKQLRTVRLRQGTLPSTIEIIERNIVIYNQIIGQLNSRNKVV